MKPEEAKKIIANALNGYIEDCAGLDSEEAKQIEKAWKVFSTDEDKNPMCKKYSDSEAIPNEDDSYSLCDGDCCE